MKKAVLVATSSDLRGTVTDARAMRQALVRSFGYDANHVRLLHRDREPSDPSYASRARVQAACEWLVRGAAAGDSLLFYFSGHGNARCLELCPQPGQPSAVSGTRLVEWLVAPLPAGVKLHVVLDACESGGLLPLRFTLRPRVRVGRDGRAICDDACEMTRRTSHVPVEAAASKATIVVVAACMSHQNAHEVSRVSAPRPNAIDHGCATYALLRVLETHGDRQTYGDLYARMVGKMAEHGQTPRVFSNVCFEPHRTLFRL